ncbi:MAG: chaperone modulator CbpM [Candidatus Berkiella sp.]
MAKHPVIEGIILDESVTYTIHDLLEMENSNEAMLIEMHEYGIIEPQGETQEKWVFTSWSVIRFKKAVRLHHDLAINWAGIALVLDLIDERDALHQHVLQLKKQLE